MALFISNENQRILWDMIHRYNNIGVLGNQKEQWFKNIVGQQYQAIVSKYGQNITRDQVMAINRDVLQIMIHQLQQYQQQQQPSSQPLSHRPDSKSAAYAGELDARQQQYQSMTQKISPPEINFREQEDTAITNMEELLEKQRREREEEAMQFTPPPPTKDAFKHPTMGSGGTGIEYSGVSSSTIMSVDSGRITALEKRVAELERIVAELKSLKN